MKIDYSEAAKKASIGYEIWLGCMVKGKKELFDQVRVLSFALWLHIPCTMPVLCLATIIPTSASLFFEVFTMLGFGKDLSAVGFRLSIGGCKLVCIAGVVESLHCWRECAHALEERIIIIVVGGAISYSNYFGGGSFHLESMTRF